MFMVRKVLFENKNARCYLVASFLISIGTGIFFLILNLYLRNLGISHQIIGFINAFYYLGIAILSIVSGIISNIAGHKKSFLLGTLMQFLGEVGLLLNGCKICMFASILIIGFGASLFLVNEAPFLSRNSTSYEQTHLFGLSFGSVIFGNFVGELTGSFLLARINNNLLMGLRSSIIISALLTLSGLFLINRIDEEWIVEEEESLVSKIKNPLLRIFVNRTHLKIIFAFSITEFLMGVGAGTLIPFFNLYFVDFQNIKLEKLGVIIGAQSILIALASFYAPYLLKRFKKFYVVIGLESLSLPFILLLLCKNHFVSIISYMIRGILINASIPIYNSYYMDLMDDEVKAIASSVKEVSWNLAWFLGSSVFGMLNGNFKSAILIFFSFYAVGITLFFSLATRNSKIMIL